jgi:lipid-binding SYLF domain-containing protein
MLNVTRRDITKFAAALALATLVAPAWAKSAGEIDAAAEQTLKQLRETEPVSEKMIKEAKGILVFPQIVKGGFIVGGAGGDGVLLVHGKPDGYYRSASLSFGLQAGLTEYGYVVFLMDEGAMKYLKQSDGWDLGASPNVTILDKSAAAQVSASSVRQGVYVFFLDQKGLFGGLSLEGTKVSKIAE